MAQYNQFETTTLSFEKQELNEGQIRAVALARGYQFFAISNVPEMPWGRVRGWLAVIREDSVEMQDWLSQQDRDLEPLEIAGAVFARRILGRGQLDIDSMLPAARYLGKAAAEAGENLLGVLCEANIQVESVMSDGTYLEPAEGDSGL